MYHHLLVNVDELWLKGKNRPAYFSALNSHLREVLSEQLPKEHRLKREKHRFVVEFPNGFSTNLLEVLNKIPGIYSLIPCRKISCDLSTMIETAIEQMQEKVKDKMGHTFRVSCRRIDKRFPYKSMEIAEIIGRKILEWSKKESLPLKVNLNNPDTIVDIKIFSNKAYLSTDIVHGVGGLPLGTSGNLVTLISGGFDSPVASCMMSRRGCLQTFVFFHSYPFVEEEVLDKILAIVRILAKYQRNPILYRVPFGNLQQKIAQKCEPSYRTLLFRHYMLWGASLLGEKIGAEALLTGDCLSQVSSQTIGNICLLDKSSFLPVFRPLLGFNKNEIIAWSKRVGTHDISLLPQKDACSLLSPEHPVLIPKQDYWDHFLKYNDFKDELFHAIENADIYRAFDGKKVERGEFATKS